MAPAGEAPAASWIDGLVASAGTPAEPIAAERLAEADGDVVVVGAEIAVSDGWLAALRRRPEGLAVATISAPAIAGRDPLALSRAAQGPGQALVLDAPAGPCVLLTREALELVGAADPSDLAAFGARCARRGLVHLMADGVAVGGMAADVDEGSSAAHALALARQRAAGPSVTIDARSLVAGGAGTQVHTLELIRALAARERLGLRIVLPPREDVDPGAMRELEALGGLELKSYDEVVDAGVETDIVHRPYQVFTVHDLRLLQRLGRRIIVTQQDQLLYRNPSYFGSVAEWEDYRQVCRIALAWADRTVFFTEHARREALRDELLDEAQTAVVEIGVDRAEPPAGAAERPPGIADAPFLLQLGTDLAHKNRPFAIALLRALRAQGWEGGLVLAGPRAEHGATREEEAELLGPGDPVVTLDRVDEAQRRWLLEQCAALVFPSVEEGFGLMPFEAAEAGVPCLFAPVGAMAETLPADVAVLVPWDAEASAARAAPLLAAGGERDAHVALLREAAGRFRWSATAERMERLYDEVLAAPRRQVAPIVAAEVEHQRRYEEFRARTGEDGMALLGPDGFLPPAMVRPLLGVLSRPALRRPLFAVLRALYRAGHRSG